jgi:hypothetical protein
MVFNIIENFLLFLTLLNSAIYPSASSSFYFLFAMGLTLESMVRDQKRIKTKFIIAIILALLSFGIMITKGIFLIILNDGEDLNLDKN